MALGHIACSMLALVGVHRTKHALMWPAIVASVSRRYHEARSLQVIKCLTYTAFFIVTALVLILKSESEWAAVVHCSLVASNVGYL